MPAEDLKDDEVIKKNITETEEEFAVDANENEEKKFKTKAHFDSGTKFIIVSQDHGENGQMTPVLQESRQNSRPIWASK